jgi:hypothetical protein
MSELKPCSFCGAKSTVTYIEKKAKCIGFVVKTKSAKYNLLQMDTKTNP